MKRKPEHSKVEPKQHQTPLTTYTQDTVLEVLAPLCGWRRKGLFYERQPSAIEQYLEFLGRKRPGRPRKVAIAREAAELRQQRPNMRNPQIAAELNKRHGTEDKNHRDYLTPDAVRMLLKRHNPNKT